MLNVCEKHSGIDSPILISPPQSHTGAASEETFFLPCIILWDPYVSFPTIFPPESIKCPSCGLETKFSYWNDGSSKHTQPRLIHGVDNIALLVSAVYKCDNGHKRLAHDESVLRMFPLQSTIPFILLSRTGITSDFLKLCSSLIAHGLNFYKMETLLLERRWEYYLTKLEALNWYQSMEGKVVSQSEFWSSPLSSSPSNDIIAKCFLTNFLRNEQLYLQEITAVPTTSVISFDHTFKVAANIGYLRTDGEWIPQ